MEEGRLRRAPVLLIDRRVDSWVRRYPDVHVQTVATRQGRTRWMESPSDSIQLAGVGSAERRNTSPDSVAGLPSRPATPTAQRCWSAPRTAAQVDHHKQFWRPSQRQHL